MTGEFPSVYQPDDGRWSDPSDAGPVVEQGGEFRTGWPPAVYSPGERRELSPLARRVADRVAEHPDFPRPGIVFRDLAPVLLDPELTADIVSELEREARDRGADVVVAVESRGFLFGAPLAISLDLPLAIVRKQGKLPGDTITRQYDLEYGDAELELQLEALRSGQAVFVVDDLLATGGTLAAAAHLVERAGARVAGLGVVVELASLGGRDRLGDYNLLSILMLE